MIPVKLRLRNFMCYHDPTPLDFTGIHLACLAGDNGHGKSALLDAITWALWGRARARSDDELVFAGATDMEVEFEFLLGGAQYRVIRKRELGRRSRGALELQVKDNGDFRCFTASTQRETQARIIDILRMDYDTFINSALLLQGRADEFTVKPPTERKRVLADILGLSIYDEYEQRAKDLAREKEQAEREVQGRIHEIDRELEHRTEYEAELKAAQADLAELSSHAKASEALLQELRDKLKTVEGQRDQLAEVRSRLHSAEAQLRDLDEQIEALAKRLGAYEAIVERRAEIEEGYSALVNARERESECSAKLSQLLLLQQDRARLDKVVSEARQGLEVEKQLAADKAEELAKLAGQVAHLRAEHAKVSKELRDLAGVQEKAEATKRSIGQLSEDSSAVSALNKQLKVEMAALKDKLLLLQEPTATCPLCRQDLGEDDRQQLLTQFEEEGRGQGDLYRKNTTKLEQIALEVTALQSDLGDMEVELRRMPALQGREATLAKAVQEAVEAAAQLEEQRDLLSCLQHQLDRRDFAAEEQGLLAAREARITDLGYDTAVHNKARQALATLAHFEADKAQLDRADQALTELRENQQQLTKARESWLASVETARQRHVELSAAVAGLEEVAEKLRAKQQETDELRGREGHARLVVGAAQQKLDYCRHLAEERREGATTVKALAQERSLYEELRVAFGKKGLQAMIIESVIPELEDEANELLQRMTEGRMSMHFETQRDTKAGSTIETLDIHISDEAGPRRYEMYSGGEAFRIDFAIRIALSKLLARRAGAQLQTLIIDEGFGTQDADGRQKLVEAINSIKDDFACIIVITHIEELKDAFPTRVDVYKTPDGSQILLN